MTPVIALSLLFISPRFLWTGRGRINFIFSRAGRNKNIIFYRFTCMEIRIIIRNRRRKNYANIIIFYWVRKTIAIRPRIEKQRKLQARNRINANFARAPRTTKTVRAIIALQ